MSTTFPPYVERQLKLLATRTTLYRSIDLGINKFAHPDGTGGRAHEVCMVFRRPGGDVLTFRKTFYPPGVYRLPTGGILPGEGIVDALTREAKEETGLSGAPHRLLAVVGYRAGEAGQHPSTYTFAFLLDDVRAAPVAVDPQEQVEDFQWVDVDQLPHMADVLARLGTTWSPDLEGTWGDWGRFRAAIHTVIWEALQER